jgi:serine phosphatase RsbU (regulator of sigma subunit)
MVNSYYKLFILFALLLSFSPGFSQYNNNGNHLITNYTPEEYGGASQNWSIVQDNRGVIYVGNEGAVLEYDGKKWSKIENNNGSYIKSLAVDNKGTVYVGGINEFGFLKPDKKGKMTYEELSTNIDSSFKDIWNIYVIENSVYFCSASNKIYKYSEDTIEAISYKTKTHFLDFLVEETLYLGDYEKGLMKLKDGEVASVDGGEFYKLKDIFSILPFKENKLLITVSNEGAYVFNKNNGKSTSLNKFNKIYEELNNYLKTAQIYNGCLLSNGDYVFGSLNDGLIIADKTTGKIKYHYTDENGLIDPTVINVFESNDNQLWLGLNKGISKIEYNSSFKKFDKSDGLSGIGDEVIRYKSKLIVGTSAGAFQQKFDNRGFPYFEQVNGINGQVRDFIKFEPSDKNEKHLIAGTHRGIYDISNPDQVEKLWKSSDFYKTNVLTISDYRPNRIYVGHYRGVSWLEYKNGQWKNHRDLKDKIDVNVDNIVNMNDSIIWVSSALSGIFRIINHKNVVEYDTTKGLPAMGGNQVYKIRGELKIATKHGLYQYDRHLDKIVKDTTFGNKYSKKSIPLVFKRNENQYFLVRKQNNYEILEEIVLKKDSLIIKKDPFLRLKGKVYKGCYEDSDGSFWFSTSDAILNYSPDLKSSYQKKFNALIRNVTLGKDSTLFHGTYYKDTSSYTTSLIQPDALKYQIDYKHNDISFRYAAPFFIREQDVEFSYKLVGYDEKWSNWETKADKGYTNLDEGQYTFLLKAKNIYNKESEPASFSFTILPPWYRTIWAYIAYVIAGVFLVIGIVKWYTRRLEKEKIRLENIVQERTKEVVEKKNQIEQQRDEIAKKNRDITDSIEYASKIQNAVLPDNEITQEILPEHFIFFRPRDIVSGDFYWISKKDDMLIIIAADCTGHGVPGAFMSMLGVSLLNEIVNKHEVSQANEILTELRSEVKRTLKQRGEEGEAKDGMDIALTIVDMKNMKLQYAGAYNPLFLFRNGKLIEFKADRMPVGIYIKEKPEFTNHVIDLQKGDTFYLFSDGYQDQFGGKDGTKFKIKRLKEVLGEIQDKSMNEQKEFLEKTFDDWKGNYDQLDDVILIGVRINQ